MAYKFTSEFIPEIISDLTAAATSKTNVLLTWGSSIVAVSYSLRASTSPILGDTEWNAATEIVTGMVPLAGLTQSYNATISSPGTQLYFSVRFNTIDAISDVSNSPFVVMWSDSNPSVVSLSYSNVTNNSVTVNWDSPCEDSLFSTESILRSMTNWSVSATGVGQLIWVTWSNKLGKLFAISNSSVYSSEDCISWTLIQALSPATTSLSSITWSPILKKLLIVATSGDYYSSTDGVTWTGFVPVNGEGFHQVSWSTAISKFIGTSPTLVGSSADGITWNVTSTYSGQSTWSLKEVSNPATANWVAYGEYGGEKIFVSCGGGTYPNRIRRSVDNGTTWAEKSIAPMGAIPYAIAFGGGVFVIAAHNNTGNCISRSTDGGLTWSSVNSSTAYWRSITYGNGVFVVGADNGAVARSTDGGATWQYISTPISGDWLGAAYGNGIFVLTADNYMGGPQRIIRSIDYGLTWTAHSSVDDSKNWNNIVFGNGIFLAETINGFMHSTDGATWVASAGVSNRYFNLAFGNGVFMAFVGDGGGQFVFTSLDGINWVQTTGSIPAGYWNDAAYGNGIFLAVSGGGGGSVMTWNVGSSVVFSTAIESKISGVDTLVCNTSGAVLKSLNGISWTTVTAPTMANIAWSATRNLFAGIDTGYARLSTDAITWYNSNALPAGNWSRVIYSNELDLFIATENKDAASTQVLTSMDGVTWTARTTPSLLLGYGQPIYLPSFGKTIKFNNTGNMLTSESVSGSGKTTSYELRHSLLELNPGNFGSGQLVTGMPTSDTPGSTQSVSVTGLNPGTTVYFAMASTDINGGVSDLSPVSSVLLASTVDTINTLVAVPGVNNGEILLSWVTPSDNGGEIGGYVIKYQPNLPITDFYGVNTVTIIQSIVPQTHGTPDSFLVTGLDIKKTYGFSIKAYAIGYPVNLSALSNSPTATTPDVDAPSPVNLSAQASPLITGQITLTWLSPTDWGTPAVPATEYFIRYREGSTPIIESDWGSLSILTPPNTPNGVGIPESLQINGLGDDLDYNFVIKSRDAAGNISAISNSAMAHTLDIIAPAKIALSIVDVQATQVAISWPAPTDNTSAGGQVTSYELRYALSPITNESNWGLAYIAFGVPAPTTPGIIQEYTFEGLTPLTEYYFAMRSTDEAGNVSLISDFIHASTPELTDITPPGRITLTVPSNLLTDTTATLNWLAVTDIGITGLPEAATGYDIRYNTVEISNVNWDTSTVVSNGLHPKDPGLAEEFVIRSLEPDTEYHFAIKAFDLFGNYSLVSIDVMAVTQPKMYGDITAISFIGDSELSVVWLKPSTANYSVLYQTKIWKNSVSEPNYWVNIGTHEELKLIDVGDRLKGYYVHKFTGLDNDNLYNIRIRSVDNVYSANENDLGGFTSNTPSSFTNEDPTVERLMRGLDKKYSKDPNGLIYKFLYVMALHLRDFYLDFKTLAIPQLNILTSTDEFVDTWGFLFKVDRKSGETDEEYSQRIVRSILIEKSTKDGLIRALAPYTTDGRVEIVEGVLNQGSLYFNNSYFGYDPYGTDVVGIPQIMNIHLNNLYGTSEISFGSEFGAQGSDSFTVCVRLTAKASGSPASKQNTLGVIAEIIKTYKTAGTAYSIFEKDYQNYIILT